MSITQSLRARVARLERQVVESAVYGFATPRRPWKDAAEREAFWQRIEGVRRPGIDARAVFIAHINRNQVEQQ